MILMHFKNKENDERIKILRFFS